MSEVREGLVKYQYNLYNFACSLTFNHTEAQDLLQDTCVLALRFECTFQEGTNLLSWLLTLMRNQAIDSYRYKERHRTAILSDEVANKSAGSDDTELSVYTREVLRDIKKLRPEHRDVLLAHIQGRNYEDGAKQCGVVEGTYRSRLFRAREKLAERIV